MSLAPKPLWSRTKGGDLSGFLRVCGHGGGWSLDVSHAHARDGGLLSGQRLCFPERIAHRLQGRLASLFTCLFWKCFSPMKSMCSKATLDSFSSGQWPGQGPGSLAWAPPVLSASVQGTLTSSSFPSMVQIMPFPPHFLQRVAKSREEREYAVKIASV